MAGEWRRGTAGQKCIIAHARQCVQECLWVRLSSSVELMGTTALTAAVYSTPPQHHNNTTRILLVLPPSALWSETGSATAPHSTAPQCQACQVWNLAIWSTSSSRPMEGRLWHTPTLSSSPVCLRLRCSVLPRSLWLCRSARTRPRLQVLWWESSMERHPTSQTSWTTSPTSSPTRQ